MGQVAEGLAGNSRSEVDTPSLQDLIELDQQDVQRLVRIHVPAHGLDLGHHGAQRLLGRIGVDIAPGGAPLAMTLDAPPQKVETLVDMGDAGLFRRQA
jgi:hypothetical protein